MIKILILLKYVILVAYTKLLKNLIAGVRNPLPIKLRKEEYKPNSVFKIEIEQQKACLIFFRLLV